eukprot:CAMPEP_0197616458 /NCGR_PEP_ID=MMETSP1326-20131121/60540_1 /TAXON_ID=1155430 /ORGANISM="Genus nov. species nov., Strain RCC2288" /LENGTH=532 /DNA_ID=CAMNT_0043185345 /DNA_START=200 /DNA_END=1794 /DNA_ORIENTATION=-
MRRMPMRDPEAYTLDNFDRAPSPRVGGGRNKHKPKVAKAKQDPDSWVQKIALPALELKESGLPVSLEAIDKLQAGQRVPRLTSPRSIKACLELGVDPKMLAPVTLADFRDDKVEKQLWMLQYQHATDLRETLLEKLMDMRLNFEAAPGAGIRIEARRDTLGLNFEADAVAKQFRPGKSGGGGTAEVLAAAESTTVQKANERLERLQEKQRKLSAARVEALGESSRLQQELEGKIARVDEMAERRSEMRRTQERGRIDDRYQGTMHAAAAERQAEKDRRRDMAVQFKKEQEQMVAQRRAEALAKAEAAEASERRAEREREWNRRHQAIVDEQEAAVESKRRHMDAEERRRAKLRKAREEERDVQMAAAAAEFEARLKKAKAAGEANSEGRRSELLEREEHAAARRRLMDEERRQELELEIARNREKEEIRLRAKGAADRMESERVARIVAAAEEADRKLEEQKAAQDFQRQLTLTMRTLGVEDRNRRAEMQQKQEALHRFTLRQKMDRDSSKTMFIKDMKERMTRRAVEANME